LSNLVNLERLICSNNNLTELKGLDKLVNLEALHCSEPEPEPEPEPDKLDLILSKIEKLEQDIAEIKTTN